MSTNKRLTGKVALVTGAGDPRSIGRGIARALADEGADVIVNDIRSDWLSSAVKDIQARGVRGAAFAADVSKPDQVAALFADAVAALGRID
ncbi:MAG: SDR family oxidoreductase, partial [Phototrophicaceae bacterium]